MSSKRKSTLWYHPFVDIFKEWRIGSWLSCTKTGKTVSRTIDGTLRRPVWKLDGPVTSETFVEFPNFDKRAVPPIDPTLAPRGASTKSTKELRPTLGPGGTLALTGRFLYVQIKPMDGKNWAIHADITTYYDRVVRLSLGSSFRAPRIRLGRVLEIPVDAAPNKWTVLAVDLRKLTQVLCNPSQAASLSLRPRSALAAGSGTASPGRPPAMGRYYGDYFVCLKALRLCCAASYRAAFSSDVALSPRSLPREFSMPLPPDFAFGEFYSFDWVPALPGAAAEAMHDAIVEKLAKGGAGGSARGKRGRGSRGTRKMRPMGDMASLGVQHVSAHRLELFMRKEGIRVIELQGVKGLEEEPMDSGKAGGGKHDDHVEHQEQKVGGSQAAEGSSKGHAPALTSRSDGKAAARSPSCSMAAEPRAEGVSSTSQPEYLAADYLRARQPHAAQAGQRATGVHTSESADSARQACTVDSGKSSAAREPSSDSSRRVAFERAGDGRGELDEGKGGEPLASRYSDDQHGPDAATQERQLPVAGRGSDLAASTSIRRSELPSGTAMRMEGSADNTDRRVLAFDGAGEAPPPATVGLSQQRTHHPESRPRGPDRVPVPEEQPEPRRPGYSSPPSMPETVQPTSSRTTLLMASEPALALDHVAGMSPAPVKPKASGGGRGAEDLLWSASGDEIVFPSGRFAIAMQADLVAPGAGDAYSPEGLSHLRRSQRIFAGEGGPIEHLCLSDDGLVLATVQTVVARVHGRREGRVGTMIESGASRRRRLGPSSSSTRGQEEQASLQSVPAVRLWNYRTGECLAVLPCPSHETVGGVAISPDSRQVALHGVDERGRTLVLVWDVSAAAKHVLQSHGVHASASASASGADGDAPVLHSSKPVIPMKEFSVAARQVSDFAITRARFSPFEAGRLVSCGHENVRFWRVKRGYLPGCPVVLDQHARGTEFTDVAFEPPPQGVHGDSALAPGAAGGALSLAHMSASAHRGGHRVFVCTSRGAVVQIDYSTLRVEAVFQVHSGPVRSLSVNEGFCVTAGADRYLRVWPLDFSEFFVEVRYEAPLAASACSPDGLRVAATTDARAVGVLDISSRSYHTAARCHTGSILDIAVKPPTPVIPDRLFFLDGDRPTESLYAARQAIQESEGFVHHIESDDVATASSDGTVRVWSSRSLQQLFEFVAPGDTPTCLCFRPPSTVPESAAAAVAGSLSAAVLGATTGRETDADAAAALDGATAETEDTADAAVAEYHLVVGYQSGCVRVFHVPTAQLVEEYRQHDAPVRRIGFAAPPPPGPTPVEMRRAREAVDGWALRAEPAAQRAQPMFMMTAAEDGRIVVHDALHGYVPVRVLLASSVPSGSACAGVGLDVSPAGDLLTASFSWEGKDGSASSVATVLETSGFTAVSRLRVPRALPSRLSSRRVQDPGVEDDKAREKAALLGAGISGEDAGAPAAGVSSRGLGEAGLVEVRFLHGGRQVVGTMSNGRILRWDTGTGRVIRDLAAIESKLRPTAGTSSTVHGTRRLPLDASPNGYFLVTGSPQGSVRMWDATLAGPPRDAAVSVSPKGGHSGAVSAVQFAWNGRTMYSGGVDGSLIVWRVGVEAGQRVCCGHLAPSAVRIVTMASSEVAQDDDRSMPASSRGPPSEYGGGRSAGAGPTLMMAPHGAAGREDDILGTGAGYNGEDGPSRGRGSLGLHHSPAKTNLHEGIESAGGFQDAGKGTLQFAGDDSSVDHDVAGGSLGQIDSILHDPPQGRRKKTGGKKGGKGRKAAGRIHASAPRQQPSAGLPPPPTSPVPNLPPSATPTAHAKEMLREGSPGRNNHVQPPALPSSGQRSLAARSGAKASQAREDEDMDAYPAPLPLLRERVPSASNALSRSRALGCSCEKHERGAVLWHPSTSMLAYRLGSTLVCEDATTAEQLFLRPNDVFCSAAIQLGLRKSASGETGLPDSRATPPIPARLGPEARQIATGSWGIDCIASVYPPGRPSTDIIAVGSSPSENLYRYGSVAGIAVVERESGELTVGSTSSPGTPRFASQAVLSFRAGHVKQKTAHSGHRSRRVTTVLARRILACCLGPDGTTVFGIAEAEEQPVGTGVASRVAADSTYDAGRPSTHRGDSSSSQTGSSSSSGSSTGKRGDTRTLLVCAWSLAELAQRQAGTDRESRVSALAESMGVAPARKPVVIMPAAQRRLRIRATEPKAAVGDAYEDGAGLLRRSDVVSSMSCLTNRVALVAGIMGLIEIRVQPKPQGGFGHSDSEGASDEMMGAAPPNPAGRSRNPRDRIELAMRPLVSARSMQKGLPPVQSAGGFQPCMRTVSTMPLDFDEDDPVTGPVGLVCAGDNAGRLWLLRADCAKPGASTAGMQQLKAKYSVVSCEWMRAPFAFGGGLSQNAITAITSASWVKLPAGDSGAGRLPARQVVGPWQLVSGNEAGELALWNVVAAGATPGPQRPGVGRSAGSAASEAALQLVARKDVGSASPLLGGIVDSAWAMGGIESGEGVDGVVAMQGPAGGLYFVDWSDASGAPCLVVPAAGAKSSSGIAAATTLVQAPDGGPGSSSALSVSNSAGLGGYVGKVLRKVLPVVVVAKSWTGEGTDWQVADPGPTSFQVWTMGAPGGSGAGPQPVLDASLAPLPGAMVPAGQSPRPTAMSAEPGKEWERYLLESFGSEMEDLARKQAFPASLSEIMSGEPDKSGILPFSIPKKSSASRGRHIAVGFSDGAVHVLRVSRGGRAKELRAVARPHDAAVTCIAWSHALLRSPRTSTVEIPDMRPGTRDVRGATRRRRADVERQAPSFWVIAVGYSDGTVALLPFAPDEENEAVNAEAADVADLATKAADEQQAAARGQRKRPRRPESLRRAGGLTSVTELPIRLQEPNHVLLEPEAGIEAAPAAPSVATGRSSKSGLRPSASFKSLGGTTQGTSVFEDYPHIPVSSVCCSMWDPTQLAVAMADGTVRSYRLSVTTPTAKNVDSVVQRTAKQERAAVKERARSRKAQRQVAAGGAAGALTAPGAAALEAAGEARDVAGAALVGRQSGETRLPTALEIAVELRAAKDFEAYLPWSGLGDADADAVETEAGESDASGSGSSLDTQSLGPFLCFSPAMPSTLACVAATDAFDDPALATADEDEQVSSMRFVAEGAARAAVSDGSLLRKQQTRSAMWVFDLQTRACPDAMVLDGAQVSSIAPAPKMRVRTSLADTAAVVDSAARAATDIVAQEARMRAAAAGPGFDAMDADSGDEEGGLNDQDGSVLFAGGMGSNDQDELEQALADGGAIVVGTVDGRVELLRAATEGAPGPGAEALASIHLSYATASVSGSSMGMGMAGRRLGAAAASTVDGLGSSGGRAGDRLAIGQTADFAAVLSLGVLQGETGMEGRSGPNGTPGADAPVIRLLAATATGMHAFDVGIDME